MAILRNDVGPVGLSSLLRVLLVLLVLGAAVAIVLRVYRKNFQPAVVDEYACKSDSNYEFKDPQRHPTDCY